MMMSSELYGSVMRPLRGYISIMLSRCWGTSEKVGSVRHRGKASFYRTRRYKIRLRFPDQLWPCFWRSLDWRLWFKSSGSEESGNVGRLIEWNYKRAGTLMRLTVVGMSLVLENDSTGGKANLT